MILIYAYECACVWKCHDDVPRKKVVSVRLGPRRDWPILSTTNVSPMLFSHNMLVYLQFFAFWFSILGLTLHYVAFTGTEAKQIWLTPTLAIRECLTSGTPRLQSRGFTAA